jgi:hypothetical protein
MIAVPRAKLLNQKRPVLKTVRNLANSATSPHAGKSVGPTMICRWITLYCDRSSQRSRETRALSRGKRWTISLDRPSRDSQSFP